MAKNVGYLHSRLPLLRAKLTIDRPLGVVLSHIAPVRPPSVDLTTQLATFASTLIRSRQNSVPPSRPSAPRKTFSPASSPRI